MCAVADCALQTNEGADGVQTPSLSQAEHGWGRAQDVQQQAVFQVFSAAIGCTGGQLVGHWAA
jgi:hypothetical protein